MWKMQLVDDSHLLIKYASEDVVTLRVQDPNTQPAFFVLYNFNTAEVSLSLHTFSMLNQTRVLEYNIDGIICRDCKELCTDCAKVLIENKLFDHVAYNIILQVKLYVIKINHNCGDCVSGVRCMGELLLW